MNSPESVSRLKKLETCGLEWREDKKGKVKVWIRLNREQIEETRELEAARERRKFKLLEFSTLE